MGKNIIFCADGTWDAPGQTSKSGDPESSNVQKLFESLAGSSPLSATDDEMEISAPPTDGIKSQVAKYIYGVGSDTNALARFAGGTLGTGLVSRLVRGYTYISRNYQPGDRIFLVGFSRGSYTVRALAGLIVARGLLDWDGMSLVQGSTQSYAAGMKAWSDYRKASAPGNKDFLKKMADALVDVQGWLNNVQNNVISLKFVENVPIEAIGVWDTVGALGIPEFNLCDSTCNDVFQFANTALSFKVKLGFHAVAVDEQREDFTPTLWDKRDGVTQVLFPGAHADVGGGYPTTNNESGLSDFSLMWMFNKLVEAGLLPSQLVPIKPDASGVAHQPWLTSPFDILPQAKRHFPTGLALCQTVIDRMNADRVVIQGAPNAPYQPSNLVNSYLLPDWSGALPGVTIESTL